MKRLLVVTMLLTALIVVPGTAHAQSPPHEDIQGWYTWSTTLAPGVTDPQGDGDVTWPQPLVGKGQIAPACGQWVQQDLYEGNWWQIHDVIGDGMLTRTNGQPEDHAIVKAWKFVYGGDCVEPTPTPTPTPTVTPTPTPTPTQTPPPTVHTERHVDCDLGVAIILTETTFSDGTTKTTTEQAPLTKDEEASCDSTPTPTPTSKPSVTPSPSHPAPHKPRPTTEPSPTSTTSIPPSEPSSPSTPAPQPQPKHTLPETGSEAGAVAGLAGIISVTGALLLWVARRRKGHETA